VSCYDSEEVRDCDEMGSGMVCRDLNGDGVIDALDGGNGCEVRGEESDLVGDGYFDADYGEYGRVHPVPQDSMPDPEDPMENEPQVLPPLGEEPMLVLQNSGFGLQELSLKDDIFTTSEMPSTMPSNNEEWEEEEEFNSEDSLEYDYSEDYAYENTEDSEDSEEEASLKNDISTTSGMPSNDQEWEEEKEFNSEDLAEEEDSEDSDNTEDSEDWEEEKETESYTDDDKCPIENHCRSPSGICGPSVTCLTNPCALVHCDIGTCVVNYCGGCHAVCSTLVSDNGADDSSSSSTSVTVIPSDMPKYSTDCEWHIHINEFMTCTNSDEYPSVWDTDVNLKPLFKFESAEACCAMFTQDCAIVEVECTPNKVQSYSFVPISDLRALKIWEMPWDFGPNPHWKIEDAKLTNILATGAYATSDLVLRVNVPTSATMKCTAVIKTSTPFDTFRVIVNGVERNVFMNDEKGSTQIVTEFDAGDKTVVFRVQNTHHNVGIDRSENGDLGNGHVSLYQCQISGLGYYAEKLQLISPQAASAKATRSSIISLNNDISTTSEMLPTMPSNNEEEEFDSEDSADEEDSEDYQYSEDWEEEEESSTGDEKCPIENHCRSPSGLCGPSVTCLENPCALALCDIGTCVVNYCGGCHAVCSTLVPDDGAGDSPSSTSVAMTADLKFNSPPTETTPQFQQTSTTRPNCTILTRKKCAKNLQCTFVGQVCAYKNDDDQDSGSIAMATPWNSDNMPILMDGSDPWTRKNRRECRTDKACKFTDSYCSKITNKPADLNTTTAATSVTTVQTTNNANSAYSTECTWHIKLNQPYACSNSGKYPADWTDEIKQHYLFDTAEECCDKVASGEDCVVLDTCHDVPSTEMSEYSTDCEWHIHLQEVKTCTNSDMYPSVWDTDANLKPLFKFESAEACCHQMFPQNCTIVEEECTPADANKVQEDVVFVPISDLRALKIWEMPWDFGPNPQWKIEDAKLTNILATGVNDVSD